MDGEFREYEKIEFYDEEQDGFAEFFVLERTRVNGSEYLLAAQEIDQDTDAYIFKVVNEHPEEGADLVIELVEDDTELESVGKIFAELMDEDTKIEI